MMIGGLRETIAKLAEQTTLRGDAVTTEAVAFDPKRLAERLGARSRARRCAPRFRRDRAPVSQVSGQSRLRFQMKSSQVRDGNYL